ncbi:protein phosphatase 1F isoform X1 [Brienomyrus brachyistius]|uniref:protein phosphatase 1F isoform X1 n=1 Tax=Brienomyrus brachyistius TaxID=42636 RepID=UPI0020B37B55|nr:protein phosphatase 1F isoform X1 [Brienomyrus brachyistius]
MGTEAASTERFLREFVEEFPEPLSPEDPLPLTPMSSRIGVDEVRGESLDWAQRLLAARKAPPLLTALLCHTAVTELLKSDLTTCHCTTDPGQEPIFLQSSSVQRLLFSKLREVVFSWHQTPPALPLGPSRFLLCSTHAIRNTRRKMEDRHVALSEFNQMFGIQDGVDRGYYAVFDGHGGVDAATFAATHLHVLLGQHEALASNPSEALRNSFSCTDDMFKEKATRERLRSGSTGVAVLLAGDWLHVAWLGDSQAMLVRQGDPVTLMDPHKPEREDEKQRIEDLGGCITFMGCWRVNGTYAVSRAIGDFDQKPYISGDADCASLQLDGREDYVLLACDGFFDTVRPADVPGLVHDALLEGAGEVDAVAQQLVAQAKAAGSSDNITVLLVFLREPALLLHEAGHPLGLAARPPPDGTPTQREDTGGPGATLSR